MLVFKVCLPFAIPPKELVCGQVAIATTPTAFKQFLVRVDWNSAAFSPPCPPSLGRAVKFYFFINFDQIIFGK
jgi:hypothetical protein